MQLRIVASRHSAFYSPLIATISAGFLEGEGLSATYGVLQKGKKSHALIRDGVADIMQSAVSSNWKPMERGEAPLPVHFALINRRDGFFLLQRDSGIHEAFRWQDLEGRTLLADHGLQPLVMLKYAVHRNGVDWSRIAVIDRGAPEAMTESCRGGEGDYVHLQGPAPQELADSGIGQVVASVGASMPQVAFSTLCCSREFIDTEVFRAFLRAYVSAREWVNTAPPAEIAAQEASFFPDMSVQALARAIEDYQKLGNWSGGIEITRDLYDQALDVFEFSGEVAHRHPWEEVCATSIAAIS